MSHRLKEDDPVYYKCALRGLLQSAKENGLQVDFRIDNEKCIISFKNEIGELTEVIIG